MTNGGVILTIPGVTIDRQHITQPGRAVSVDTVKRAYVEDKNSALPVIGVQIVRVASYLFIGSLLLGVLAVEYLTEGTRAYNVTLGIIIAPMVSVPFLGLLGVGIWLPTRKKRSYRVQVETTLGTIMVYKTSDSEMAQQVLKAVELARKEAD